MDHGMEETILGEKKIVIIVTIVGILKIKEMI
jgi:hypothetical protein